MIYLISPFVFRHYIIFKGVFRQIGMLEVSLTCLQRFASVMKLKLDVSNGKELSYFFVVLVMKCLWVLMVGNTNNVASFSYLIYPDKIKL
jgi:hypothetical protein